MTPEQLDALIRERLPDNARNRITPADLRAVCHALAASAPSAPDAATSAPARRTAAHRLFLFERYV